jgi:hypothetical protein
LRANGSRECAPDDAKQSRGQRKESDCFLARAPKKNQSRNVLIFLTVANAVAKETLILSSG